MAGPQINVQASQTALVNSIQAGINAYNQRFASQNQINLQVNARSFSQPLGRITGDVKDFESALAASNARVVAFGASTAVLGGVIRSFKEIATVTIEVEKNLADINRVFNLSTAQLQKFSSALFEVSKSTASSFGDASKAALEFSRQGLKAEDVLQRTTDALLLARLGGLSTANAIDALTASVNGFKNTGITTTQILNKLVAVEQNYAVGAGDLAEALSRTGQAAQEAGVSIDQLNALVTSAQEKTARGGAVIGNALKTIFTRLQRPETLDQLEAFNISVRDVQGNILPAISILKNFSSAYSQLADAQRAQLSEQVAGVYQVNILKAIIGDLNSEQSAYNGALRDGANASNEAEVAAAKLNQTLDALVAQTGTAAQQFANNIGQVTFEPLAKYTAQTFKSIFENLNDLLEGEGVGSTFANGFLKGIRNIIAGPGAIAAFYTLFKLIQNSFNFLTQALPQIAGITTESQKRKDIEASVLRILQQEGPLRQALLGYTGNQAAQAQVVLNAARAQTAEYEQQLQIAQRLAPLLAAKGVVVNPKSGQKGIAATRSGGYIPKITKMAETIGAQAGGYNPGQVVRSPVGGVMNTAEDVKYIPGFAQPFINPPAGSKAGRAHRQRSIQQTGVDPYMAAKGYLPNFSRNIPIENLPKQEVKSSGYLKNLYDFVNPTDLYTEPKFNIERISLPLTSQEYTNKAQDYIEQSLKSGVNIGNLKYQNIKLSKFLSEKFDPKTLSNTDPNVKRGNLSNIKGALGEIDTYKILKFGDAKTKKLANKYGIDFEVKSDDNKLISLIESKTNQNLVPDEVVIAKALTYLGRKNKYKNNGPQADIINLPSDLALFQPKDLPTNSLGFIPNFAEMSMSQIAAAVRLGKMSEADARAMGWKPTSEKVAERKSRVSQEKAEKLAGISYKTIPVPWKTFGEFGGTNYDYGAAYEKHALSVLKGKYPNIQDAISAGIPGGPSSRVDALDKTTKTFFEMKGGDPTTPAELMAKFKGVRVQLVDKYKKELDTWNDVLVSNPNWNYFNGFIPNFADLDADLDTDARRMLINSGTIPFVVDLERRRIAESSAADDMFHSQIVNKKFIDPKTKKPIYPKLYKDDIHSAFWKDTFVRGFVDSSTAKVHFDLTTPQKEDKNFMQKYSVLLEQVRNKYAKKFEEEINKAKQTPPINPKNPPPSQKFRNQLGPYPVNHFNNGFIPNFAYEQAVMSLEQNLSGKKAILDTSTGPFPFVRNSGQANFADAVADHGGLDKALSDSMAGQKAAGLMYGGYVPNFADFDITGTALQSRKGGAVSFKNINAAINNYIKSINLLTTDNKQISDAITKLLPQFQLNQQSFNEVRRAAIEHAKAERVAAQAAQQAASQTQQQIQQNNQNRTRSLSQRIGGFIGEQTGIGRERGQAMGRLQDSRLSKLSGNVGFQLAAPLLGGMLEQFITRGKDRTQLSQTERFAGNAASSVLTGVSTGAALGSAIPILGTAAGAAAGALVGLTNAFVQSQESIEDVNKKLEDFKNNTQSTVDAGKGIIETFRNLQNLDPDSLEAFDANQKLQEYFVKISETGLDEKFREAGNDINLLTQALKEYEAGKITEAKRQAEKQSLMYKKSLSEEEINKKKILKSEQVTGTRTYRKFKPTEQQKRIYGENVTEGMVPYGAAQYEDATYTVDLGKQFATKGAAGKSNFQTVAVQYSQLFEDLGTIEKALGSDFKEFSDIINSNFTNAEFLQFQVVNALKGYDLKGVDPKQFAATLELVNEESGKYGKFISNNFFDIYKNIKDGVVQTAKQKAEKDIKQFNATKLLQTLKDNVDSYVFDIAKQLQTREFETSRFNLLDSAANELIDNLISPIQASSRQIKTKLRQTNMSQESERLRLSSDISSGVGKQIFETLGMGNEDTIKKLQGTIENLQNPQVSENTLRTLISQTTDIQTAREAGFKNVDPKALAQLNTQLKQQLQNTIMLSEKQNQQNQIVDLEIKLMERRATTAQVLLDLEYKLMESELQRNTEINKSISEREIQTAREKAAFERPGFGFGMSPENIQAEKARTQREELNRNQATARENIFKGGNNFLQRQATTLTQNLKNSLQTQLDQLSLSNPNFEGSIQDIAVRPDLYKDLIPSDFDTELYNRTSKALSGLSQIELMDFKSVDEYKNKLLEVKNVLGPISKGNEDVYKSIKSQLEAIDDLNSKQKTESTILDINLETQRLQALAAGEINRRYVERLKYLSETADQEQRAADALEIRLQALDTYQSRESNFYGLGVMGKAGTQIGFNQERLRIRQEQTTQQSVTGARNAINDFAAYQNEITNVAGPLPENAEKAREKVRAAIGNINTEIKNLDDAKALADNLEKARSSLDAGSEDAKKLAGFEKQIRDILQKNTSELEKQKAIQDLINKGVADQAADRISMSKGFQSGFDRLIEDADQIGFKLGNEIPGMFADGMTNALMEVAKGTKTIGDAFTDMAINFGQTLMQEVMRAAIGKALGSAFGGLGLFGNQKGGLIRAQNGMYISGGRNGDRNLALLEDGEYVLNRNAVDSFGGPGVLDKINYDMAPRFGSKMQSGGAFELMPEMQYNKDKEFDYTGNLMSGSSNLGAIDQANYTSYAFAEDAYFKKMREKAIQDEQERVQKEFQSKQKRAQLISSIVGAVGSIALAGGISSMAAESAAKAGTDAASKAGQLSVSETASQVTKEGFAKAQEAGGKTLTEFIKNNPSDVLLKGQSFSSLNMMNQFQSGVNPLKISGEFGKFGGNAQLSSLLSQQGFAPVKSATTGLFGNIFTSGAGVAKGNIGGRRQTGGLIGFNSGGFVPYGSRLSDTIPALLTGGEYVMSAPSVKKYGLGTMNSMNAGAYQDGGSTATTNNNTSNNATNIAINIDKSGKSVYGADNNSYEKNDIRFSKQMAKEINAVVLRTMSNEKRYGGELYKNPLRS